MRREWVRVRNWYADFGARLIFATRAIDKAYRLFDKIRSEFVLAVASGAVIERFNDLSYGKTNSYDPASSAFRKYLFPWEEQVIEKFFPPPPARILVGGAGGGREVFALANRGYEVVAFEPSRALVESMSNMVSEGMDIKVFCAGYDDLPHLSPVKLGNSMANLEDMNTFDAAIVGWGSFSHLTNKESRVRTLKTFAKATKGPIVISFLSFRPNAKDIPPPSKLRRFLPGNFNREVGNAFSVYIGFYHEMHEAEIIDIAHQAGLNMVHLSTDGRDTNWPHAVLMPG
jgi:SAM-dependent methyltransferase